LHNIKDFCNYGIKLQLGGGNLRSIVKLIILVVLSWNLGGCQTASYQEQHKKFMLERQGSKEYITSAFGISLGSYFDIKNSTGNIIDTSDGYMFDPMDPYEDFSTYYVIRAAKTGIVAKIHAYSDEMSEDACNNKYRTIRSIYNEKYTFMSSRRDDNYNRFSEYMDANAGYLKVGCSGFVNYRLAVEYGNYDLNRIAKDERMAIDKESKDKSGL